MQVAAHSALMAFGVALVFILGVISGLYLTLPTSGTQHDQEH